MDIKKENYERWISEVYEAPNGPFEQKIPPAFALKQQLSTEIEKKLDLFYEDNPWVRDDLYGDGTVQTTIKKKQKKKKKTFLRAEYPGTKVEDIVFSFNNPRLILALRARGKAIAA